MFESRISAGATEKLPSSENPNISTWSYDMESHAKKCLERYCELAEYKQYCHVGNTALLFEGVGRSKSSPWSLRAWCRGGAGHEDAEATCLAQTQETLEARVSEGPPRPISKKRNKLHLFDGVRRQGRDQAAQGQVLKHSEEEARACYPDLVVASLGPQRKDKPNGEVSARFLFDGTHGLAVNTRTRVRDQERSPIAADLKRALREKAQFRQPTCRTHSGHKRSAQTITRASVRLAFSSVVK